MKSFVKKLLDGGFKPEFKTKDGVVFKSKNGVVISYNDGTAEGFIKQHINETEISNEILNEILNESFIKKIGMVIITILGFTYFTTDITVIYGNSMHPTYKNYEIILRSKKSKEIEKILVKKNSVIKFIGPNGEQFVKRVIGFPNDVIEFDVNNIYIGDELIDTNNISPNRPKGMTTIKTKKTKNGPSAIITKKERDIQILTLKDNEYFVIGDNRLNSTDSRDFGPIQFTNIVSIIDK